MQVSAQNSLTWLQTTPAAVTAADQISSAYGQVSPGDDASGADAGSSAISALQSPAQMFSSASLGTLISSQSDSGQSEFGQSDSAQFGSDGTGAASASSATPASHGRHHRHHGEVASPATDAGGASTTSGAGPTAATTASDDAAAQGDLAQVLTEM